MKNQPASTSDQGRVKIAIDKKGGKKKKRGPLKKAIKWIEKNCFNLLISLAQLLINLLFYTLRFRWYGRENFENIHKEGSPVIYAIWHQRILIFVKTHGRQNAHVMVSAHRDGEILARILRKFGIHGVRGSTGRGGRQALLRLVRVLKGGYDITITPDGPRGPRYKLQPGVLLLAQKTGTPIIPGAFGAHPCWKMKTWDRFLVPKPFSKIAIVVGEPIWIPSEWTEEESFEKYVEIVEQAIIEATEKADEFAKTLPPASRTGGFYNKSDMVN